MSQQIINNEGKGAIARNGINDNFTELYKRDASGYGFLESASAAVNVAALQAALDIGGTITINTPGEYELNDTLKIGSDTKLVCCPGVVFKKVASYGNVIINKGAETRTYNENIEIDGLTVEVNGMESLIDQDVPGLRAQIGFFYVKHLILRNYKCEDLGNAQFGIQFIRWEDVYFDNLILGGDKDGLDIGVGFNGLFENIKFTTFDDAIALYGAGYPSVTVEVGDVHDITFRNCIDYVHSGGGFTCRIMTGSWADWANGSTYQTGDLCTNGGSIYISNNANGFSAVAANAPVHSSGEVTGADGITWKYCNDDTIKSYNVYNITFDNCTYYDIRPPINIKFIDDVWMRSVYPGTETLSYVKNIRLINSLIDGPSQVFPTHANCKSVTIANCVFVDIDGVILSGTPYADSNDELFVTFTGNIIRDTADGILIQNLKDGQLTRMISSGNILDNSTLILYVRDLGTARLICPDIPILHSDLEDLTPVRGDVCRTTEGLFSYVQDDYWQDMNEVLGPNLTINGEFNGDTDWIKGVGWTIPAGGKAVCDGSQVADSMLYQAQAKEDGEYFLHIFKITGYSDGSLQARGGNFGEERSGNGVFFEKLLNTTYNNNTLIANADFIGSVEYYYCYKII